MGQRLRAVSAWREGGGTEAHEGLREGGRAGRWYRASEGGREKRSKGRRESMLFKLPYVHRGMCACQHAPRPVSSFLSGAINLCFLAPLQTLSLAPSLPAILLKLQLA